MSMLINRNMEYLTNIRNLHPDEVKLLTYELSTTFNSNLWGAHSHPRGIKNYIQENYPSIGPLRHGKTLWLEAVSNDITSVYRDVVSMPGTRKIIKELADVNDYGRCYWHNLRPGDHIDRHADGTTLYFGSVLKRYQIYLDIPPTAEIFMDDILQDSNKIKNSIVDFNYLVPHSFTNNSNTNFTFAIIDVLKDNIKVPNR